MSAGAAVREPLAAEPAAAVWEELARLAGKETGEQPIARLQRVLERDPQDERDKFRLRARDRNSVKAARAGEQHVVDRKPVRLRQAIAGDDLEIEMHMHERRSIGIERESVQHARVPDPGCRAGELESAL